jgi:hypothetical protein
MLLTNSRFIRRSPLALLRPHCKRPRRRAAERSDEFAPSKANAHLPLPCEGAYSARIARTERAVLTLGNAGQVGLRELTILDTLLD